MGQASMRKWRRRAERVLGCGGRSCALRLRLRLREERRDLRTGLVYLAYTHPTWVGRDALVNLGIIDPSGYRLVRSCKCS